MKNISVKLGDNQVLDDLSLYIRDREFITLLGPSGCGKTTILRIIAGFLEPDEGDIIFEDKKINGVPPHKRQVNTIFQRYALFPHLNVYENVAFGLRIKKLPEQEIEQTVSEMLGIVNLKGFEKRNINSLSGGQGVLPRLGRLARCADGRRPHQLQHRDDALLPAVHGAIRRARQAHRQAAARHNIYICYSRSGGGSYHV